MGDGNAKRGGVEVTRDLSHDRARNLANRFINAWNSRDPAAILTFAAQDVEFRAPPLGPVRRGRQELREWLETVFRALPDVRFEMVGEPLVSLDSSRVAIEWKLEGTFTGPYEPPGFAPTGQRLRDHGVSVLELNEDGEIRYWLMPSDMMGVGRQMGAVPTEGSLADRMGLWMQRRTAARMRRKAGAS